MDFEILPQMIIVFSAAGILLIVGKNFSKVKAASREESFFTQLAQSGAKADKEKRKFVYLYDRAVRRINKENYQKAIAKFWIWMEKFLRKLRISFLKIDGKIVSFLDSVRERNTQSFEKLKETERSIRKNMETENYARFWNVKKGGIDAKKTMKFAPKYDGIERKDDSAITAGDVEIVGASVVSMEAISEAKNKEMEVGKDEIVVDELMAADKQYVPVEMAIPAIGDTENINMEYDGAEIKAELVQDDAKDIANEGESDSQEDNQKIRTRKEQEYIETLMKNPADIKAYWKLGLIYSKRRNYDDALACFRQIVKIDPTYTKAKQKAIELMDKMKRK